MPYRISAIVLAGGLGSRFGKDARKQFASLSGRPLLCHSLEAFERAASIDDIVVVAPSDDINQVWQLAASHKISKVVAVVPGGRTRQESSHQGIVAATGDYVQIHDAARPLVTTELIERVSKAVLEYPCVDVVVPATDTLVEHADGMVSRIPRRDHYGYGQTPQAFERELILSCHRRAADDGNIGNVTDDASLVLQYSGGGCLVVPGFPQNMKVTYPWDLDMVDVLYRTIGTASASGVASAEVSGEAAMIFGGASGIGKAVCELLQNLGCRTFVLSRSTSPAVDVRDPASLRVAFKHAEQAHGSSIAYVVNSAGMLTRRRFSQTPGTEFGHEFSTNFFGAVNVTRIAMSRNVRSLVHLGSSAFSRGRGSYAAYSAAKAALVSFVQAVAEEQVSMQLNVVSPCRTATDMRKRCFGDEDPTTLLEPSDVATEVVKALVTTNYHGLNILMRRD